MAMLTKLASGSGLSNSTRVMHRIKFKSDLGDVIICDSKQSPISTKQARVQAKNSRFVCITTEDEITYDVGIELDTENLFETYKNYQSIGGYFGISIPSGQLCITSSEHWGEKDTTEFLTVTPGEYIAEIKTFDFEYEDYREQLVQLVGSKEVAHWEFVDKLGLWAWLPILGFMFGLFFPTFREYWHYGMMLVTFSWLPYVLMRKTKRYQRVEAAIKKHSQTLPNQLVFIKPLPEGQNLPGGYVHA